MDQISLETPPMTDAMRQEIEKQSQLARLARLARSGISNFYWIAALSVVNSVVDLIGGGVHFVAGLAITQLVDAFATAFVQDLPDLAIFLRLLQLALDVGIIGMFVLFGYLGIKNQRGAIIVGMLLYTVDAILMLFFQDFVSFAFHLFFLWGLWGGLQALNQLRKLTSPAVQNNFPSAIS